MTDILWFSQQLTREVKKITANKIGNNTVIKTEIFELFLFLNWNITVFKNNIKLKSKPVNTK